jgi:uncharacterized Zn-finger protein
MSTPKIKIITKKCYYSTLNILYLSIKKNLKRLITKNNSIFLDISLNVNIYQTTQRYISERKTLHSHRYDNLKSIGLNLSFQGNFVTLLPC